MYIPSLYPVAVVKMLDIINTIMEDRSDRSPRSYDPSFSCSSDLDIYMSFLICLSEFNNDSSTGGPTAAIVSTDKLSLELGRFFPRGSLIFYFFFQQCKLTSSSCTHFNICPCFVLFCFIYFPEFSCAESEMLKCNYMYTEPSVSHN